MTALLLLAFGPALQGCGPPTPEAQVSGFLNAWNAGDEAKAAGFTMEGDISAFKTGDTFLMAERPSFSLGTPDFRGELCYLPVTLHAAEGDQQGTFILVTRERTWKVSLTQTMTAWLEARRKL